MLEYAAPGSALLEEDLAQGAELADAGLQNAQEAAAPAGAASDALLPAQVVASSTAVPAVTDPAGSVVTETVVAAATEAPSQPEASPALAQAAGRDAAAVVSVTEPQVQAPAVDASTDAEHAAEEVVEEAVNAVVEVIERPEVAAVPTEAAETLEAAEAAVATPPDVTNVTSAAGPAIEAAVPPLEAAVPKLNGQSGAPAEGPPAGSADGVATLAGSEVLLEGVNPEAAAQSPEALAAQPTANGAVAKGSAAPTAGAKRAKWDAPASTAGGAMPLQEPCHHRAHLILFWCYIVAHATSFRRIAA